MRQDILIFSLAIAGLTAGCADFEAGELSDPADECVYCDDKADSFAVNPRGYEAHAVVELANRAPFDELDVEVGLYSTAAEGIVANRPFERIEEIDDVRWVGRQSIRALAEYVREEGMVGACGDAVVQTGIESCDDGNQRSGDGCSSVCGPDVRHVMGHEPIEMTGALEARQVSSFEVELEEGDTIVAHLNQRKGISWDPALEIHSGGTRVMYSHASGGEDAHLPYRDDELDDGLRLRESGIYTIIYENRSDVRGEFELTIACIDGPCSLMKDLDADGVADREDNCRATPNPKQLDGDADSIGDACDLDAGFDRFEGSWDGELEEAIREANRPFRTASYGSARLFMFSELDNRGGSVFCAYTGWSLMTEQIPDHTVMNTEHVWPQSQDGPESDLHHLFPTRSDANSRRGSYPFGTVSEPTWEKGGAALGYDGAGAVVWEPRDEVKGDVARAMFYVAVNYGHDIDDAQERVLRAWSELDPPNAAERVRNQQIANFQGSRNHFVDQPSLADRIADF